MNILTVSRLNRYLKSLIEADEKLSDLYVKGEISNFTRIYRSGHLYFTLKDEGGAIKAVMFKSYAGDLRFEPENGMAVLVRGSVGVYERDGACQLYVTDMQPDGAGGLAVAFEQRKRKLAELGLFNDAHKKPLPAYPERIGVVTSDTGAAWRDIINVIERRYPCATLVLCPSQVQGESAAASLADALQTLDRDGRCDVIIIGRGGGSAEDLWAFNDEKLALAIFEASTPVVSAVGHEVDYTICDFVADLRAPTPSAAAEMVTPSVSAVSQRLAQCRGAISENAFYTLRHGAARLENLRRSPGLASPMGYVAKNQQRLDFFAQSLYNIKKTDANRFREALRARASLLESLSPIKVLSRGYCMALRDGGAVTEASRLKPGDEISLRFRDGAARASVLEVCDEEEFNL